MSLRVRAEEGVSWMFGMDGPGSSRAFWVPVGELAADASALGCKSTTVVQQVVSRSVTEPNVMRIRMEEDLR